MRVSTPEATAIDLVRHPRACGYLDNVATVLLALAERLDPKTLAGVATLARTPDIQRLGYRLDRVGLESMASPLAALVASRRARPVLLRPDRESGRLRPDPRWHVIANEEVSPDR